MIISNAKTLDGKSISLEIEDGLDYSKFDYDNNLVVG